LFENGLLHVFSWQLLAKFSTQKGGRKVVGVGGAVCFTSKNSAQSETNIEFLIWKFEELGSNPHTHTHTENLGTKFEM